jgi:1,4-alpha-glucan branching enzyme
VSTDRGELALVLHTHMPYVLGFGTWPFGEEWLWEAIVTCYLPLLRVLGRAPLTLSLTPVLCDQLEAPGAMARCLSFLREVRPESHRLDVEEFRRRGEGRLVTEVRRSAAEYEAAVDALETLGDGLPAALGAHCTWTSSATHAVLPLLATDAGVALQVETGVASHRRRFGGWEGGFWLPECAHAPWLDALLEEAGVRATCVELTRRFGAGDVRHLRPLISEDGPVLWPIDRQTMALVWSDGGYPADPAYRDRHRLTPRDHRVWRNDGAPYDHQAARAVARGHARDFVARAYERVREGGVCVCAFDTELLGHWWHEGVAWLEGVIDESARQGLALTTLDDALTRHQPARAPAPAELELTSWGEGGDLRTWSGPAVADLAWGARSAELRLLAMSDRPPDAALRQLLAQQSSDWAFLASRGTAGEYPRERAQGHAHALARIVEGGAEPADQLSDLAPELIGWTR